jgi:hypothetical protein
MSIESIMTAFGYVIANWVGYGCSFSSTSFQWRFPLSIQVVFALIILLAAPFLPGTFLSLQRHHLNYGHYTLTDG